MNADLQARIAAIRAECEKLIELDKMATALPWMILKIIRGNDGCAPFRNATTPDAQIIAHSRNVSPAMARVIVMAIRYAEDTDDKILLLGIANQWEGK